MLAYIIRRVLLAIPTLFGISVLSFVIMHLPPGDFLTTYASILSQQGEGIATEQLEQTRQENTKLGAILKDNNIPYATAIQRAGTRGGA